MTEDGHQCAREEGTNAIARENQTIKDNIQVGVAIASKRMYYDSCEVPLSISFYWIS